MKIAIGADHRGFDHKQFLKEHVSDSIEWIDVGTDSTRRTDYPVFAKSVAQLIQKGDVDRGILICSSGIGMAVTANRFKGVYAGLVWNEEIARMSREHDNVNILVLPSHFVSQEDAVTMVKVWLASIFLGGRYQTRIDMIDDIK